MAGNTIGQLFRLTSFGESHGEVIGGVIDGCPAGILLDLGYISQELEKRKTGNPIFSSTRKEPEIIEFLSGMFEGKTTGTPLAFIIRNQDQRPRDYEGLRDIYRPSHADYTYQAKYGIRDHRGGGRSSARETAVRVVAGAIARLILKTQGINLKAFTCAIGGLSLSPSFPLSDLTYSETSTLRCPDPELEQEMIRLLEGLKTKGDSTGGIVQCIVTGVPAGIGEPVFDKLEADLAKAMLSINACTGFEYGSGFAAASSTGSQNNDPWEMDSHQKMKTTQNHSGGIQGGISNGQDISFRAAFKPVASIRMSQQTVNKQGENVVLQMEGRHDICIVPRAVPIVEAMTALVILDQFMRKNASFSFTN